MKNIIIYELPKSPVDFCSIIQYSSPNACCVCSLRFEIFYIVDLFYSEVFKFLLEVSGPYFSSTTVKFLPSFRSVSISVLCVQ